MGEFDLNIGAQVRCEDGKCGRLHKVVVNPDTQEVSDLILEKGFLLTEDRVLPIGSVEEATAQEIRLSITADELTHFEAYDEKVFEVPGPAWQQRGAYERGEAVKWTPMATPYGMVASRPIVPVVRQRVHEGISARETVVEQGTAVENAQGRGGTVDHVLVDADSGDIEYYVVHRGLLARPVIVPASEVQEVTEDAVFIDLSDDELDKLPRYRPPAKARVLTKLQERLDESPFDFSGAKAVLEGGVLQLSGTVADIAGKRRAEATARSIEGILDVENTLDTDTAIVARVTAALADDSRTELADIDVTSDRGVVTLTGQVDSAEIRDEAEEIAENQVGVMEVVNDLAIESDEDTAALERRAAGVVLGRQP
jgi:uncharacterized protein YrrD